MKFFKYQALGNDFIIIDDSLIHSKITSDSVRRICDRKFGIGADGLLFVKESHVADVKMILFNSDGSRAEMSGNGIRCFAKFLVDSGKIADHFLMIETDAGVKNIEVSNDNNFVARVAMGQPNFDISSIPAADNAHETVQNLLNVEGLSHTHLGLVSVGNPHCVIITSTNVDDIDVKTIGSTIELMNCFPNKINVEFANLISKKQAKVRVWERGVGETMACGTGACAVASYLINKKLADNSIDILLPGGSLNIYWDSMHDVFLSGSAEKVFEGSIDD